MNIYSILDSDEDEKPKVQAPKKTAAPATNTATTSTQNAAASNKESGSKPKSNNRPSNNTEFEHLPESVKTTKPKQHHKHGAKSHHGGEGETADAGNQKKRTFDRKSGTGRGREVSKNGAGRANWGNEKQEALQAEKNVEEEAAAAATTATGEEAEAVDEPKQVEEPPVETVFTLDEYNRRREEARQSSAAFSAVSIREVTADFSGMKTKTDDNSDFIALGTDKKSKGSRNKDSQRSKGTTLLDVGFTVAPTEVAVDDKFQRGSRGGDRGDRGGRGRGGDRGDRPRSSGGRGGDRGDRPRSSGGRGGDRRVNSGRGGPRVDISDANAFPSL